MKLTAASPATTFAELNFKPRLPIGGIQALTAYANGYGASVIQGPGSYGGEFGLYELAVLEGENICYTTPLTDDVLGHLTEADVTRLLGKIAALPKGGAA